EAALRQISGQAPLGERLLNDRIQASLTKVQDLAAVHGLFDREVAELERAASALIEKGGTVHPKDHKLRAVMRQYPQSCVLVASRALAEALKAEMPVQNKSHLRFL